MAGVGKILIGMTLLLVVMGMMTTLMYEHGTSADAIALNNSLGVSQTSFKASIYNPLNSSIITGVGSSNDLSASSQTMGFALAFILPDFITTLKAAIAAPNLIQLMVNSVLQIVPTGGVPVAQYVAYGIDLLIMYMLMWGLSLWMKMPAW